MQTLVSEITPETKGLTKKRQRSRVRVASRPLTLALRWGGAISGIVTRVTAEDAEGLAAWVEALENELPYAEGYANVLALAIEYGYAALDFLTAEPGTGAEVVTAPLCHACRVVEVAGPHHECSACGARFWQRLERLRPH